MYTYKGWDERKRGREKEREREGGRGGERERKGEGGREGGLVNTYRIDRE